MTGDGRRFAVRTGVAFCAAWLALVATTVTSEAAGKRFDISVQYGYHNSIKIGQWMPVVIDVTNNGAAVDGILEVEASYTLPGNGGPPSGIATYQTPISLASGATKHVRTYVTQDSQGTVEVRIVQGGHVLARASAAVPSTWTGVMAGIISDHPGALDGLGAVRSLTPLVAHLTPADISDSAMVLRAFDVIAIDDFATDTLTQGQKAALTDYVTQGGGLLLGTGGSWHKTLAGLPSELVPMHVSGSKVVGSSSALKGAAGVEVVNGEVVKGATVWLADGSQPMLVEGPVGSGFVEMATFDWTQDSVATSAVTTALLRQALVRATYGNASAPSGGGAINAKLGTTNSIATRGGTLTQVLGNLPALNLPAWWLIGSLVFVYVLLAGPINYFVLRAINRRALAWVTIPAIAVVGSAGAYGAGLLTKGTSVLANEISIVHVAQGWGRAYEEQYTGILTPTRGDYDVGLGDGRRMVSPIYYFSGNINGDPNFGAMRVNTSTQLITLPNMTAFTLRGFANEGTVPAPAVTASVAFTGNTLTGKVTNESSVRFTDGVVFAGSTYQKLRALDPGASMDLNVQLSGTSGFGQPIYVSAYPNAYTGSPVYNSAETERENETRTAVLSTLFTNPMTGIGGAVPPTLVLWTKDAFQDVTVNGGHPRTYAQAAVVIALPVAEIAGAIPSSIVQGRIVDIDADVSTGPLPGLVVAQGGTITYSFKPPIAAGKHLTAASIDSTNPFGPKGVIPVAPNGSPAPLRAEVFDWGKAAWVDFTLQDGATNTLPDGAVNPATGEVRLRVGSDGQFQSTILSLSGTVK